MGLGGVSGWGAHEAADAGMTAWDSGMLGVDCHVLGVGKAYTSFLRRPHGHAS